QRQRRLLHDADVDLALAQRFQQVDTDGRELDLRVVGAGLLEQIKRERLFGIPDRGDAYRSSLQILDRLNLARSIGRGDNGKQGQAPRHGKAANVRSDIGVGLKGNVERGGGVIDRAADQRLHGGVAAAGIDELHVEPVGLEV